MRFSFPLCLTTPMLTALSLCSFPCALLPPSFSLLSASRLPSSFHPPSFYPPSSASFLPTAVETKLASKPEIAKSLIPTFAVGCRRLTPGPGYLEALVQPNVGFVSTGIKKITETGIETVDGEVREYDTIVCATGCVLLSLRLVVSEGMRDADRTFLSRFDTSYRPRIPIIGKNGNNVQDLWHDVPTHYLSMFIGPDHPNYVRPSIPFFLSLSSSFSSLLPLPPSNILTPPTSPQFVINGPNSSLGSGSLLILFEKEVDYIVEVIGKLVTEQYKTVAVKQEAVDGAYSVVSEKTERRTDLCVFFLA